jgi:hypothetical protein
VDSDESEPAKLSATSHGQIETLRSELCISDSQFDTKNLHRAKGKN